MTLTVSSARDPGKRSARMQREHSIRLHVARLPMEAHAAFFFSIVHLLRSCSSESGYPSSSSPAKFMMKQDNKVPKMDH
jgi:hypothetical protein